VQQVKTKDLAVIGLAIIFVLFLWYQFVYSPMGAQASKANQSAQDAKQQAASLDAQVRQMTGAGAKKKASNDELQKAIPATPQVSEFLRQMQQIRDAVGIPEAFQSIAPAAPTATGGSMAISVGITAKGSYAQMMDYVNRLNKLPRLVVVDNVQITAGGAGSGTGGGPTGPVFAGSGAAPELSLQISVRLLTAGAPAAATSGGAQTPVAAPPAK
jgi:Tfp pilus assembly protein PilO